MYTITKPHFEDVKPFIYHTAYTDIGTYQKTEEGDRCVVRMYLDYFKHFVSKNYGTCFPSEIELRDVYIVFPWSKEQQTMIDLQTNPHAKWLFEYPVMREPVMLLTGVLWKLLTAIEQIDPGFFIFPK